MMALASGLGPHLLHGLAPALLPPKPPSPAGGLVGSGHPATPDTMLLTTGLQPPGHTTLKADSIQVCSAYYSSLQLLSTLLRIYG